MRTADYAIALSLLLTVTATLQFASLLADIHQETSGATGTDGGIALPDWREPAAASIRRAVDAVIQHAAPVRRGTRNLLMAQCAVKDLSSLLDAQLPTAAVEEITTNLTYATNTADKLIYQLRNLEPQRGARLSEPQWNPPRFVPHGNDHLRLVVGISTVQRSKNYLASTLRSFLSAIDSTELHEVTIVIFNANVPPSDHSDIALIKSEFSSHLASKLIRIVEREHPDEPHPEMADSSALAHRWGDDTKRVTWRSKQVLDVAWLMEYVSREPELHRPGYFLMMEDDIIAAHNWVTKVRSFADQRLFDRTDWTVASFYNPWEVRDEEVLPPYKFFGVIGQLFRSHDLPVVAEFLRKNFDQSPLDWLMVDFLKKFHGQMIVHSPSLFQHQGTVSSLPGKQQSGQAVDFQP